jgi:hypothetical protein
VAGLVSSASLVRNFAQRFEKPFTGLFLTAGLFVTVHPDVLLDSKLVSDHTQQLSIAFFQSATSDVTADDIIADGVYLYGQASEPDQIGSTYLIFEVDQGQVVGAFYMPYSSFDCFYGNVYTDRLALTVIDSYERTYHPYAIALEPQDAVAMVGNDPIAPMGLEGFHQLTEPSGNDLRLLSICQSDVQ